MHFRKYMQISEAACCAAVLLTHLQTHKELELFKKVSKVLQVALWMTAAHRTPLPLLALVLINRFQAKKPLEVRDHLQLCLTPTFLASFLQLQYHTPFPPSSLPTQHF